MMMTRTAILLIGLATVATAQPLPEPGGVPAEIMGGRPTTRPADGQPPNPAASQSTGAARPEAATRADAPLEQGRTSFTEAQARSRIEQAGFTQVEDLRLDEQGVWRARVQREGRNLRLGLDYRGTVRAE